MFNIRYGDNAIRVQIVTGGDQQYEQSVQLARRQYMESYSANISPKPTCFISCSRLDEPDVIGCVGLTCGSDRKVFFSEAYLDEDLTQHIKSKFDREIPRRAIIEIGPLSTYDPMLSVILMRIIPIITWLLGAEVLLVTATASLRRVLKHEKIQFHPLANARQERAPKTLGVNWGSYYETDPMTGLVSLREVGHLLSKSCGTWTMESVEPHMARVGGIVQSPVGPQFSREVSSL